LHANKVNAGDEGIFSEMPSIELHLREISACGVHSYTGVARLIKGCSDYKELANLMVLLS
jgi:hypothetical protein